ncbi:MAG: DUF885 domain-containing protein [Kofleriaceae bacterium]
MIRVSFACALVACSSPPKTSTITADDAPVRFSDTITQVTGHLDRLDPASAVSLGLHDFDGMLPDVSPAALDQMRAQLEKDRTTLLAAEVTTPREHTERDVLLSEVRKVLFDLVDRDVFRTNPMTYSGAINLDAYITRDYAPATQRAAGVIKLCRALPAYLAQARSNVRTPIPRPWIDTALLQTKGYLEFADKDVRQQFAIVGVPLANQADIDPALDTCKQALAEHAKWLEQQQPQGTTGFALGTERFMKMLAESQGVETDLVRLTAIAEQDLARNLKAIEEAARAIDPKRSIREVILEAANDKPAATEILATATEQAEAMRRFLIDKKIVTIPSTDVAEVRESPAFRRWNAASLDTPGPFEQRPLPSLYYISPPDPKWPEAEQRAYIIPRADLMFTTIHEVWPGHFLQHLHINKNGSRVLKSYCTYSNSEGWAHYTEEMMFDAGAGGGTPQARIGMLKEALLRNVRFVVAIGEHTGGMTVEQAAKVFEDKGFVDPGNARQQAVRGTFDPMFVSYTLGKLMIRKLRADWQRQHPAASLQDFHDAFLANGCGPVPMIRSLLLGADAGAPI